MRRICLRHPSGVPAVCARAAGDHESRRFRHDPGVVARPDRAFPCVFLCGDEVDVPAERRLALFSQPPGLAGEALGPPRHFRRQLVAVFEQETTDIVELGRVYADLAQDSCESELGRLLDAPELRGPLHSPVREAPGHDGHIRVRPRTRGTAPDGAETTTVVRRSPYTLRQASTGPFSSLAKRPRITHPTASAQI